MKIVKLASGCKPEVLEIADTLEAMRDPETKEIYDIICGDCFLCGAPAESEHFESLSEEQIKYYEEYYRQPEVFLQTASGILIMKGV